MSRPLIIFTRTPLHVGAGSSVGAIDQPIQRERHTGLPIIPASSLKGTFADCWNERNGDGKLIRGEDGNWLFGIGADTEAAAGVLQFSEARLLAFPIRSAKGSFAWITCPLILQRAARDGMIDGGLLHGLGEPGDGEALFDASQDGKLAIDGHVVLEEYTFAMKSWPGLLKLAEALAGLLDDPVWQQVAARLVIVSNGMMSYFVRNACEIAQHVRIDDETGAAADGALFNQENVPSEAMFYAVIHGFQGRGDRFKDRPAGQALSKFGSKVEEVGEVFQFGGDASTGLGYCTVKLA